ncbi:glycoside hydrolase family 28 protein [Klebsiella indica]|uniref:Glycoside hydrolase family 28 protein n=2 Tax=Enterobacterales TaxID=91347 RepID=A0A5R9LJJ3_9ENTR|nr:glycosyl hydrolase family 28 protein [Klebsiella indica]TLV19966.1 glycoside hydrolase family 28 protein [Klebsiella indica]
MHITLSERPDVPDDAPVTAWIQQAIDHIAAAGGGMLTLPAGRYVTGALVLPSHFHLYLQRGAELIASPDYADYQAGETLTVAEQSQRGLIYAYDQCNITLSGAGSINGNADFWFSPVRDEQGYRMPARERPRMIVLESCQHVCLRGIRLFNAPMWTVHLVSCQHVVVSQLTIDNDMTMANTDALDIDSCQFVHISDSLFSAADDGICLKTTNKPGNLRGPTRHVTITNCTLRSYSSAFKIGTETVDDIEDITLRDCTIIDSNRAIGIISRDGGRFRRLHFHNISFVCRYVNACHWGRADPVFISSRRRDPVVAPGAISQVSFSALRGHAQGAINLHAETAGEIDDIHFSEIQLQQRFSENAQQGSYDIRPPCNPAQPTGSGLDNAFLLNPLTGEPYGVERYPGGMPALFASGVTGLRLDNCLFERPTPIPEGWNHEAVVVERISAVEDLSRNGNGS